MVDNEIYAASDKGRIMIFDIRNRKIRESMVDVGALKSSCIDVSATRIVTGTSSGMVNIYNKASIIIYIIKINNLVKGYRLDLFNFKNQLLINIISFIYFMFDKLIFLF